LPAAPCDEPRALFDDYDGVDVIAGSPRAWRVYSVPTLWVSDAVARYHADCLLRPVPAFHWVVFDDPRMVTREDGELTLVLGQQKRRRGSYSMNVFPVRDPTVLGARAVSYGDHSSRHGVPAAQRRWLPSSDCSAGLTPKAYMSANPSRAGRWPPCHVGDGMTLLRPIAAQSPRLLQLQN
jgi:hypothetical protein